MSEALTEALLSIMSPKDSSNEASNEECAEHWDVPMPKEACARCTGSELPNPPPPTIHDGRHGRKCARCRDRRSQEIRNVRIRL